MANMQISGPPVMRTNSTTISLNLIYHLANMIWTTKILNQSIYEGFFFNDSFLKYFGILRTLLGLIFVKLCFLGIIWKTTNYWPHFFHRLYQKFSMNRMSSPLSPHLSVNSLTFCNVWFEKWPNIFWLCPTRLPFCQNYRNLGQDLLRWM